MAYCLSSGDADIAVLTLITIKLIIKSSLSFTNLSELGRS